MAREDKPAKALRARKVDPAARAYRCHVVPMAVGYCLGGLTMLLIVPFVGVPFVPGEPWAHVLYGAFAAMSIAIGIGLVVRSRIAWYATFAHGALLLLYAFLSPLWRWPDFRFGTEAIPLFALFAVIFVLAMCDLYVLTRPAFRPPRSSQP